MRSRTNFKWQITLQFDFYSILSTHSDLACKSCRFWLRRCFVAKTLNFFSTAKIDLVRQHLVGGWKWGGMKENCGLYPKCDWCKMCIGECGSVGVCEDICIYIDFKRSRVMLNTSSGVEVTQTQAGINCRIHWNDAWENNMFIRGFRVFVSGSVFTEPSHEQI